MNIQPFILFIAFVSLVSCSGNSCEFVNSTEPYHNYDEFERIPVEGTYKVSSLSSANSLNTSELTKTRLYFMKDTVTNNRLKGQFLFASYPGWDNASRENKADNFYGNWVVAKQPGGIFASDRYSISTFYLVGAKAPAKSMDAALEVRILNGRPIVIVRVFENLNTDTNTGYSMMYSTPKSKSHCNYLAFEQEYPTVNDSTKKQIGSFLRSVNQ